MTWSSPPRTPASEIDFPCRIFEEVIKAGATTINVPGHRRLTTCLEQFAATIRTLIERVVPDKAVWSVHCHNDLGLAVANPLAAVRWARQVECTINGLGERAGNASLEEIVMACDASRSLSVRHAHRHHPHRAGFQAGVGHHRLPVQPNKAIVGANAFAHESGIHQDGVLKHRETYEIMRAEDVGWTGQQAGDGQAPGRNAFRRAQELGVVIESRSSSTAPSPASKALADKKHEIFDEDLQA